MSRESRHLRSAIGKRVSVDLDNPSRKERGTLVKLGRVPRVKLDGGEERSVAAWRISVTE